MPDTRLPKLRAGRQGQWWKRLTKNLNADSGLFSSSPVKSVHQYSQSISTVSPFLGWFLGLFRWREWGCGIGLETRFGPKFPIESDLIPNQFPANVEKPKGRVFKHRSTNRGRNYHVVTPILFFYSSKFICTEARVETFWFPTIEIGIARLLSIRP